MAGSSPAALRVFFDTSVVISGAFSRRGASYVLLQMSDLGVLDGRYSPDVREEAVRNVTAKLPAALPALRVLLSDALTEGDAPSDADLRAAEPFADANDVPILAAAQAQSCAFLVTLNERDFWPPDDGVVVRRPGELLGRLRDVIRAVDDG